MTMMTLAQAQAMLPGSVLIGDGGTPIERVHSDSRTLRRGDLFVALRGEKFDAHAFLTQARSAGAAAALAERGLAESGLPGLQVADSLLALQQLAAAWRRQFTLPLIAVTGSNGKTTVTQMIAAILRQAFAGGDSQSEGQSEDQSEGALATAGNLNNHIGVPLTLCRLRAWHRAGVVELGTNHPGEIVLLAQLAAPAVVLVNNAQREHQEFLDGLDAVARENGSAIDALGADGVVVIPADDSQAPLWRQLAGTRRVCSFALDLGPAEADGAQGADNDFAANANANANANAIATTTPPAEVRGRAEWRGDRWSLQVRCAQGLLRTSVPIAGRHNAKNAVAAIACALAIGVPAAAIESGLAAFQPVAGRSRSLRVRLHGSPVTLVDDSYNANPDSVIAAIDVLASLPAPRWLVLGDMGEVGTRGPEFHAEVGRHAASRGLDAVWTAGEQSAIAARQCGAAGRHFGDVEALLAALPEAPPAASVLVKGSRFMRMERVVNALQGAADAA